jgi:hypothetical protein
MFRSLVILCALAISISAEPLAPGEVRSCRGFDSAFAIELFKLKNVRTVAVNQDHLLVLHTNGMLTEWNAKTGETPVPPAAVNVSSIAVRPDFAWAVREDDIAIKWFPGGSSSQVAGIQQVSVGTTQTVLLHIDRTVTGEGVPANLSNITSIAISKSDRFAVPPIGNRRMSPCPLLDAHAHCSPHFITISDSLLRPEKFPR